MHDWHHETGVPFEGFARSFSRLEGNMTIQTNPQMFSGKLLAHTVMESPVALAAANLEIST